MPRGSPGPRSWLGKRHWQSAAVSAPQICLLVGTQASSLLFKKMGGRKSFSFCDSLVMCDIVRASAELAN